MKNSDRFAEWIGLLIEARLDAFKEVERSLSDSLGECVMVFRRGDVRLRIVHDRGGLDYAEVSFRDGFYFVLMDVLAALHVREQRAVDEPPQLRPQLALFAGALLGLPLTQGELKAFEDLVAVAAHDRVNRGKSVT